MYAKRLILNNFRSYSSLEISFPESSIFITGINGSGKTNIIEAIYYLTLGRSFRKADDKELIKKGEQQASIYLDYHDELDNLDHTISCVINNKFKSFAVDGEEVSKLSSILGKLLAVYYEPSQVFFFKEEPSIRRKLLDETISQLSKEYLYSIGRYKKLLKERNAALSQNGDTEIIRAYRDQLINVSYRIVYERKKFIQSINKSTNELYKLLFENENDFSLLYRTNCPIDDDQKSFVQNSIQLFENNKSLETLRGTTLIGPHRDDLTGLLNKNPITSYGSQGENRIASLALKLAISKKMKEVLNHTPLLLLDDVTSDLDSNRTNKLLELTKNIGQTFITGTKVIDGIQNYTIYETSIDKTQLTRRN